MKTILHRLILLLLALCVVACASAPKQVEHSFSFDGWYDGWATKAELLAYDYGGQYHMVRRSVDSEEAKTYKWTDFLPPRSAVQGGMPPGEYLDVKWRIKATGEIREVKVDLKPLLPKEMYGTELTFVIDDRDLLVYLRPFKPDLKRITPPYDKNKPRRTIVRLAYEIYPANTYPKQ